MKEAAQIAEVGVASLDLSSFWAALKIRDIEEKYGLLQSACHASLESAFDTGPLLDLELQPESP